MDVASVGASGAYANTAVQSSRTQQQQSSQESQQVQQRDAQREQQRAQAAAESTPQPVTNAQGQTTGTLVNVTA